MGVSRLGQPHGGKWLLVPLDKSPLIPAGSRDSHSVAESFKFKQSSFSPCYRHLAVRPIVRCGRAHMLLGSLSS